MNESEMRKFAWKWLREPNIDPGLSSHDMFKLGNSVEDLISKNDLNSGECQLLGYTLVTTLPDKIQDFFVDTYIPSTINDTQYEDFMHGIFQYEFERQYGQPYDRRTSYRQP